VAAGAAGGDNFAALASVAVQLHAIGIATRGKFFYSVCKPKLVPQSMTAARVPKAFTFTQIA
jgi:hypothetical protein